MGRTDASRVLSPVVEYFLDVFERVCWSNGPISVSELARQIEISKSTAHRILGLLKARGFIVQKPGGPYRPGPKMVTLGVAALKASFSPETIDPVLDQLSSETSETALFGVWLPGSSSFLVVLERPTRHLLRFHSFLGKCIGPEILGENIEKSERLSNRHGWTPNVDTNITPDGIWSAIGSIRSTRMENPCALVILAPEVRIDDEKVTVWKELCLKKASFLSNALAGKT